MTVLRKLMRLRSLAVAVAATIAAVTPTPMAAGAAGAAGGSAPPQSWSPISLPVGLGFGSFGVVDCPSPQTCITATSVSDGFGWVPTMHKWDGATWSTIGGVYRTELWYSPTAISCSGPSSCMTVGYVTGGTLGDKIKMFALQWSASRLSFAQLPAPTSDFEMLTDVSCPTATFCMATGDSTAGAFTALWDGLNWVIDPLPEPPGYELADSSVSCTSASFCVIAGSLGSSNQPTSVVEMWDGVAWSIGDVSSVPSPAYLLDVSCVTTTSCVAVGATGSRINAAASDAIVVQWNGIDWTLSSNPRSPIVKRVLTSVSCPDPSTCVAVGYENAGSGVVPLAEQFDGTSWSLVPLAAANGSAMRDVACAVDTCVTLGYSHSMQTPLAYVGPATTLDRRVEVTWSVQENARLTQVASYLGLSPSEMQKTAVYLLAFLVGYLPAAPTPAALPVAGSSASYSTDWDASEATVLDAVATKFAVDDVDATRLSVYLLNFLLGISGH